MEEALKKLDELTEKFECEYEIEINKRHREHNYIGLNIWSLNDETYIFSEYARKNETLLDLLKDGIRKLEEWFKWK